MLRIYHALLIMLALLLAGTTARAAPVTIVSGVTGEITLSKTTLAIGETTDRTFTFVNGNVVQTTTVNATGTLAVPGTTTTITLSGPVTITSGSLLQVPLTINVPAGFQFVPGSLTINGVAQPDPAIANGSYTLTIDIPGKAASPDSSKKTLVADKLKAVGGVASLRLETNYASAVTAQQAALDGLLLAMGR